MRALDRKLLRDLWRLRAQVITVSLVVACGIAVLSGSWSTLVSLRESQRAFYDRGRFGEVFVHLGRAPDSVVGSLRAIEGVREVETRIVRDVLLDMPGMDEPAIGRIVSIERRGEPGVQRLFIRRGNPLTPERTGEVLVSEPFALAHRLEPGGRITAVVASRRVRLRVSGIALSPEYVFASAGSMVPDDRRFGILWMSHRDAARALGMDGAFDDAVFTLEHGADPGAVVVAVDRVLRPWGGRGATGRDGIPSHKFLTQEMDQLRGTATVVPVIFLAVAAFLLNLVLGRLLGTQREQMASLRALGYTRGALARHYLSMAAVVVLLGALLGTAGGAWLGRAFTDLYTDYFRFPELVYRFDVTTLVLTIAVSAASAVVATVRVVLRATSVPPAEAMRPEGPASYHPSILERLGLHRLLSVPARMVVRDLERKPLRLVASAAGIAFAVAILVVGRFSLDAIDVIIVQQFERAQREDLTVAFTRPLPRRAFLAVARLPGVRFAEPLRTVAVRLRAGHRSREVLLLGLPPRSELRPTLDRAGALVPLPEEGMLVSRELARILRVSPGAVLRAQMLEGAQLEHDVALAGTVDDLFGLFAWMRLDVLHRVLREEPGMVAGALLAVEPASLGAVSRELKALPTVAAVDRKDAALRYFRDETAKFLVVYTLFLVVFASVLANGVVYNNARIALATRARDLATLRVLGMTRGEVSVVLVGEQLVQLALALVPGLLLGRALAWLVASSTDAELFRLPVVILPRTDLFAVGVVAAASVLSALLVRRRLDRLDPTSALRARD